MTAKRYAAASTKDESLVIQTGCHDDIADDTHEEEGQGCFRSSVGKFIDRPSFEWTIIGLVMLNSIQLAVGTFDFVTENEAVSSAFTVIDVIFLSIFTIEFALYLIYKGLKVFQDAWLMFDLIILIISWASYATIDQGLQILRAIRILRATKLLSRFQNLKNISETFVRIVPKLFSLMIIMGLVFTIGSIFFTEHYRDLWANGQTERNYFSRLDLTILTLYQLLTLDAWIDVLRDVMETDPLAWIPFLIFVILTSFILTNVLIAIICEAQFDLKEEKAKEEEDRVQEDAAMLEEKMESLKGDFWSIRNTIYASCSADHNASSPTSFQTEPSSDQEELEDSNSTSQPAATRAISSKRGRQNHSPPLERGGSTILFAEGALPPDDDLERPTGPLASTRHLCGKIIYHKAAKIFFGGLILVNTAMLALGTFDFIRENSDASMTFDIFDQIFLILFTAEVAMKLCYRGPVMLYKKDKWAIYDLGIIVISWAVDSLPAARSLRVVRLFTFGHMKHILKALWSTVAEISAQLLMLLFVFYIFAVIFTSLFKDLDELSFNYFGRLDHTFLTLFQLMTMVNWAAIARECAVHYAWAPIALGFFVTISGFVLINMIVGIIVGSFATSSEVNESKQEYTAGIRSLQITFEDRADSLEHILNEIEEMLKNCDIKPKSE